MKNMIRILAQYHRRARAKELAAVLLLLSGIVTAQAPAQSAAIPLPPMGWSSWNSFSNIVDSSVIMQQARAMAGNGMQKAGYQYVNIDEGWWLGQRDGDGNIVVDPAAWPALAPGERAGDMSNIVRFVHSLGLKVGIYTDAGADGCSMYPDLGPKYFHTGSEGHYQQDFLQFAKWGFDYVKVDWCGGDKENLDPAVQYAEIARAIARAVAITGHPLYFSLCEWGKNSPWTWAPNIGGSPADIWRTSSDIVAPIVFGHEHADRKASVPKVLSNFDQGIHPEAQHTGYYNDPDMMVLGMPGLSDAQNRLHMSLWAISGAPLLVGADLTRLSGASLATLTNPAVLAIDQDPLGLQAVRIASPGTGLEVWSKRLAEPGSRAVLLLNRTGAAANLSVQWSELGLESSARVTDLWAGRDLGSQDGSYSTQVAAGDGVLLLVKGSEGVMTSLVPEPSQQPANGGAGQPVVRGHDVTFAHVASRFQIAPIEITYFNPGATPRIAELRVNGQMPTRISFPVTGSQTAGRVWIEAPLAPAPHGNVLTFSAPCDPGPEIVSLSLQ